MGYADWGYNGSTNDEGGTSGGEVVAAGAAAVAGFVGSTPFSHAGNLTPGLPGVALSGLGAAVEIAGNATAVAIVNDDSSPSD
jgi:hypothetical protein